MPRKMIDMTGQRFGALTVLRQDGSLNGALWLCRCDCGKTATVKGYHLRRGDIKTCGDTGFHRVGVKGQNYKYGENGPNQTPEKRVYTDMRGRCTNPNHTSYDNYGGRGIKVCDRWLNGEDGKHPYLCFLEDMGRRPADPDWWTGKKPYWSIDRIDNDGDYEPSNCHWATPTEQANNQRQRRVSA